ncbi:hypothetical protein ACHZG5_001503 [Yersinia enterocolitica]|uniref:Uncharacterized protein n=1 Tax=Yersinia intermedia TaxID=631 RepID=A0A208ZV18_YERIN|nr:hypothetical protein [Yersinia intermedia]EKN3392577.1 hypothetical protein [Yersinia enterocolitica]OVZ84346.1 hypothetical protein CBW57_17515 [Yersinia intermedia]
MLNSDLEEYHRKLNNDPDIKYMRGVTPAVLFRFLNGSVHLDNIRKPVINSVLTEFEDIGKCELLLPFFADMRYRGIGLKTDAFKKSLLGNYLKIYHPMHLKANDYHDDFISKQIEMVEKCISRGYALQSLPVNKTAADEWIEEYDSYSYFPTMRGFFSDDIKQCQKVMTDLKGKGMDSLYGINHEMIDALMHCICVGIDTVMNLCDGKLHPVRVMEYALMLYKESQKDARNFAENFYPDIYNETRKVLEKKIAFDTVFLYLLLSELRSIFPKGHIFLTKGWLSPERPTISYLNRRFSMPSNAVLKLQKQIVLKCILLSTLNRLKKDLSKKYGSMDLLSDIGRHFGWLDTNEDRRYEKVQSILRLDGGCICFTDDLFRTQTPVDEPSDL